ncbi:hypothetical protein NDU88_002017 [Pleurodeles waltl]|uniref:Uncharacterized protein n=1 Tax=Pleurodeles waltl TaxID=8319 RepID=A0AAV7UW02_PLEWA|nr:hypothetical protein NDU88_002017 [Pleurodeles waltl]
MSDTQYRKLVQRAVNTRKAGCLTDLEEVVSGGGGATPTKNCSRCRKSSEENENDTGGCKRKLKFSNQELAVLTEECVAYQDELFGKALVPQSQKTKIR